MSHSVTIKVWRQDSQDSAGRFESFELEVEPELSLFDTLDVLNESLVKADKRPLAFDSDCREGICGTCGLVVDGLAHGPIPTTTCQLHMHHFAGKDEIVIEPFRSRAMPVVQDCLVDKSALDRIIRAGGYVSVKTGQQPEANSILIPRKKADEAFVYASCIGCGACVATCRNAAAHLFTGAKVAQLLALPQGHPERSRRARAMVDVMDEEGFGTCSNEGECEAVCPKSVPTGAIAALNREYIRSLFMKS
ncbi:MAG: succinate dehydrogenase/fumarate reductase iron-sulfur subunit [Bradymonadales bacterium]|jgi:succinate dehydrogenase / fumarate reductase iron-sulfur subunit